MEPSLLPTAQVLRVSEVLFQKATSGLTPDQVFQAPEGTNPPIWLAGHLTHARHGLLQAAGIKTELPWKEIFGRYSKIQGRDAYPPFDEILQSWNQATTRLTAKIPTLTAEQLREQLPSELPIKDKSRLSVIAFLSFHEAYHVGQLAFVRKWLGLGGLIDG